MACGNLAIPNSDMLVNLDSLYGAGGVYAHDRYTKADLDGFLSIATDDDASMFLSRHPQLFGDMVLVDDFVDEAIDGILESAKLLETTLWLYSQDRTFDPRAWSNHVGETWRGSADRLSPYVEFHEYGNGGVFEYTSYATPYTELLVSLIDRLSRFELITEENRAVWRFDYWPYPEWDENATDDDISNAILDAREKQGFELFDLQGMTSIYAEFKKSESQEITLTDIADEIMTLHLGGILTIASNRDETRTADNGISMLWWHALDRIRHGRIYQCDACGRIGVTTKERGKKRRFCSDACKQWRSKHQDRDGRGEYVEWLPPRR